MKTNKLIIALLSVVFFESCHSLRGGAFGADTDIDPNTKISSTHNNYDLVISETGIQYTIDISTADGAAKLRKCTLEQAKKIVNAEAAMANNCAVLVRPKYTYLMDGKKLIRITVFGFPANYKNIQKDYDYVPMDNRTKVEVVTKQR